MAQKFANNYRTTFAVQLAAGVGATSVQVAAGGGAALVAKIGVEPSVTNPVKVTFARKSSGRETAWEIVTVTDRPGAGDVFTVARAQEGTAAIQWEVGELISARITAASMPTAASNQFTQEFTSIGYSIGGAFTGPTALIAHGLSSPPKLFALYLRCLVPNFGYSAGDVLAVPFWAYHGASGADNAMPYVPFGDALNFRMIRGANGQFNFFANSDGSLQYAQSPNWEFFVKAWA